MKNLCDGIEKVFDVELLKSGDKYRIKNIKGKVLNELPLEYSISDKPKVYINGNVLSKNNLILSMNGNFSHFCKNDLISVENTVLLVSVIRSSNRLLEEINSKTDLFDLSEFVVGEETIEV